MVDNPKVSASTGMVDDGTGVKEVFRVEMFDLVEVPEEQHGVFFAGDCYVILYAYRSMMIYIMMKCWENYFGR